VLGTAAGAIIGIAAWLWVYRVGNDTGVRDFRDNRPTITAAEAGGDDPHRVADALVEKWMRRFTTGEYSRASRLRDYRVDTLAVLPAGEGRYVVSARVSVKPTHWSFGSWLAGSGGTVKEGWIRGKFLRFALTRTGSGYVLHELGPGPL
jgi:hypothetical protein